MHPSEKKPNPKASLTIGTWTLDMETKRMTVRNEREVRSSDTGDGGKGTLLRTEKHSCKMIIHTVLITSEKGERILLSVCTQGARTTCTKTMASNQTDVDGKPVKDVKISYSVKQASELLGRILKVDPSVAIHGILAPLPEEQEEASEHSDIRNPDYVGA